MLREVNSYWVCGCGEKMKTSVIRLECNSVPEELIVAKVMSVSEMAKTKNGWGQVATRGRTMRTALNKQGFSDIQVFARYELEIQALKKIINIKKDWNQKKTKTVVNE